MTAKLRGSSGLPRALGAGALYFALVFAAGMILGPIRVLLVAPRVGERMAELLEAPLMLCVIVLASRWIARRLRVSPTEPARVAMGLVGLALVLGLELALVRFVRGVPVREYLTERDPVAGAVYYSLLAVFAVMPLVWLRASSGTRAPRSAPPR